MCRRFICGRHKELPYGLLPDSSAALAADSLRLCEEAGWHWLRMPLYPLAEARILGANIRESESGAWCGGPIDTLPEAKLSGPWADFFLEPIRESAKLGKPVLLELKGPLSVLDSLVSTVDVYRYLRRDLPYLTELQAALLDWGGRCVQAGAGIISLADSLATKDLIGEKNFRAHFWPLFRPLLEGLLALTEQPKVFLCGKMSQDLCDLGLLWAEALPLPEAMPLDEALPSAEGQLFGLDCVNDPGRKRDFLYHLALAE